MSAASALMAAATIFAALRAHTQPPPQTHPSGPQKVTGLAYRDISFGRDLKCSLLLHDTAGSEFRASSWGHEMARVAFDGSRYWFWIRQYDRRRYYTCGAAEIAEKPLIPPLRPSFTRWAKNDEGRVAAKTSFSDGEYEVEISVSDGMVTRQEYKVDGEPKFTVEVRAFQTAGGSSFPRLATITMWEEGRSVEVDMGEVEVNPKEMPDTSPPEGMQAVGL